MNVSRYVVLSSSGALLAVIPATALDAADRTVEAHGYASFDDDPTILAVQADGSSAPVELDQLLPR